MISLPWGAPRVGLDTQPSTIVDCRRFARIKFPFPSSFGSWLLFRAGSGAALLEVGRTPSFLGVQPPLQRVRKHFGVSVHSESSPAGRKRRAIKHRGLL